MVGEEYVLARIDIVAFSKLSKQYPDMNVFGSVEKIASDSNEKIRRITEACKKDLKLECSMYGDTIDIYFRTGDHNNTLILMLLEVVAEAQRKALGLGLFVKGAVVVGELLRTENGFTGPAMVDARETECKCLFPCVTITDSVMAVVDAAAKEKFRIDQDVTDFRNNLITDGNFLNYIEACPFEFWMRKEPDLPFHRVSLTSAIERYEKILPDDPSKHKIYTEMYKYAVENHNKVCEKHGACGEMIDKNKIGCFLQH